MFKIWHRAGSKFQRSLYPDLLGVFPTTEDASRALRDRARTFAFLTEKDYIILPDGINPNCKPPKDDSPPVRKAANETTDPKYFVTANDLGRNLPKSLKEPRTLEETRKKCQEYISKNPGVELIIARVVSTMKARIEVEES